MQTSLSRFSRRSSFLIHTLKRARGITLLYTALLVIVAPFWLTLMIVSGGWSGYQEFSFELYGGAVFVGSLAAVFYGLSTCEFMHEKDGMDMYYSIPIKRSDLFLSMIKANMFCLLLPQLATFLLTVGVLLLSGNADVDWSSLVFGIFCTLLFQAVVFAGFVFIGVHMGNGLDTFLFTLGMFAMPAAVLMIIYTILEVYLYGFWVPNYLEDIVIPATPF